MFKTFFHSNRGSAVVEFALLFPILLVLFFGLVEFSRYTLIHQKLEKTVNTMADLITQSEKACDPEMNTFRQIADEVMKPISFASGTVTFSSVVNYTSDTGACTANHACISWQYTPGSSSSPRSNIGSTGGTPVLPNNMEVQSGQNYIVAEVYYNFSPLVLVTIPGLFTSLSNRELYRIAIYKPRITNLSTRHSTCN